MARTLTSFDVSLRVIPLSAFQLMKNLWRAPRKRLTFACASLLLRFQWQRQTASSAGQFSSFAVPPGRAQWRRMQTACTCLVTASSPSMSTTSRRCRQLAASRCQVLDRGQWESPSTRLLTRFTFQVTKTTSSYEFPLAVARLTSGHFYRSSGEVLLDCRSAAGLGVFSWPASKTESWKSTVHRQVSSKQNFLHATQN